MFLSVVLFLPRKKPDHFLIVLASAYRKNIFLKGKQAHQLIENLPEYFSLRIGYSDNDCDRYIVVVPSYFLFITAYGYKTS